MTQKHNPPPIELQKEGGDISKMDSLDFDIFKGEGTTGRDVELDPDELAKLSDVQQREVAAEERQQKEKLKLREKEKRAQRKQERHRWKRKD